MPVETWQPADSASLDGLVYQSCVRILPDITGNAAAAAVVAVAAGPIDVEVTTVPVVAPTAAAAAPAATSTATSTTTSGSTAAIRKPVCRIIKFTHNTAGRVVAAPVVVAEAAPGGGEASASSAVTEPPSRVLPPRSDRTAKLVALWRGTYASLFATADEAITCYADMQFDGDGNEISGSTVAAVVPVTAAANGDADDDAKGAAPSCTPPPPSTRFLWPSQSAASSYGTAPARTTPSPPHRHNGHSHVQGSIVDPRSGRCVCGRELRLLRMAMTVGGDGAAGDESNLDADVGIAGASGNFVCTCWEVTAQARRAMSGCKDSSGGDVSSTGDDDASSGSPPGPPSPPQPVITPSPRLFTFLALGTGQPLSNVLSNLQAGHDAVVMKAAAAAGAAGTLADGRGSAVCFDFADLSLPYPLLAASVASGVGKGSTGAWSPPRKSQRQATGVVSQGGTAHSMMMKGAAAATVGGDVGDPNLDATAPCTPPRRSYTSTSSDALNYGDGDDEGFSLSAACSPATVSTDPSPHLSSPAAGSIIMSSPPMSSSASRYVTGISSGGQLQFAAVTPPRHGGTGTNNNDSIAGGVKSGMSAPSLLPSTSRWGSPSSASASATGTVMSTPPPGLPPLLKAPSSPSPLTSWPSPVPVFRRPTYGEAGFGQHVPVSGVEVLAEQPAEGVGTVTPPQPP